MNSQFESNITNIKRLVLLITGKDTEVHITYKGTGYGITKPWNIRCDIREINGEHLDNAAEELLSNLISEVQAKINSAEKEAASFKETLKNIAKSN